MQSDRFYHLLFSPQVEKLKDHRVFWLSLSLAIATVFAGLAMYQAFQGNYIVQDDARQHVFWMQRFFDPDLFPNDPIADYFQSVAPLGYSLLYRFFAIFWISPWWINKLLPLGLGLVTTLYCFRIAMRFLPIPAIAFLATLLLNQSLWMKDDLVSATPRAFVYPLFLAFLYYFLDRALIPCLIAIALLGLFYPQYLLVAAGLLVLQFFQVSWGKQDGEPSGGFPIRLLDDRQYARFLAAALAVAIVLLGFYAFTSSDFDPVISAASSRTWPEFSTLGRNPFFYDNPWQFYFIGKRSGLLHDGLIRPATLLLALLLPLLLWLPNRFLLKQRLGEIRILPQILLVALALFVAAHATLFKLHLPSRYTEHTSRIVFAFAAAIAIGLILESLLRTFAEMEAVRSRRSKARLATIVTLVVISGALLAYPKFVNDFPTTKYKQGEFPETYTFFREQPKDTRVASLSEEADNIPSFSQRSVIVAREYAIPYHWGYYEKFRIKANDLIQAQYSPELKKVTDIIKKYGIDFWLLDRDAFRPSYFEASWVMQYPGSANYARQFIQEEKTPAIESLASQCSVFREKSLNILSADCILVAGGEPPLTEPPPPLEPESAESESAESESPSASPSP